ncbi:MAG: phosphotransferase [Zoogloeaceae bacterium]|jgi:hypothetical protein|nr:phosphotransferase [Zoogloeaceae bacterium]
MSEIRNEERAAEFERWWRLRGVWVEEANQRRGGESGVMRLPPAEPDGPPLYLKRQTGHLCRSAAHPFGRPTILRELEAYQAFARLGIHTPKVIYGAARQSENGWEALLVTEALQGFAPLEEWFARNHDAAEKAEMWRRLAETLARLHSAGWQHGCCYPKHIFVRLETESPPRIEIALLDLEKSRRRLLAFRASAHDLGQLARHRGAIPPEELVFFQDAYRRAREQYAARKKSLRAKDRKLL